MVFVTGDCHRDFSKLMYDFAPGEKLTKEDHVIICGDFGGVWYGNDADGQILDRLEELPFTTLFVCGNHENFDLLGKFPVKEWHGGRVHEIRPSVLHLMRGEVFGICGKKFFAFGGARSHDIEGGVLDRNSETFEEDAAYALLHRLCYRIDHESWWKEEMPDETEMEHGRECLKKAGLDVDFVITHDCPSDILPFLYRGRENNADSLGLYLAKIRQELSYKRWYFGHHHRDIDVTAKDIALYHRIERIV